MFGGNSSMTTQSSALPQLRKRRAVWSLDMDGSVFNEKYRNTYRFNANAAVDENPGLMTHIVSDAIDNEHDAVEVIIGSNRQDFDIDTKVSERDKTETAVSAITKIYEKLKSVLTCPVELNKSLMADHYYGRQPGTTFDDIQKGNSSAAWHGRKAILDHSKFSLLYQQMQELSKNHPDEEITFNFCDDQESILKNLKTFCAMYPMFIPHNVHLNLFYYEGNYYPALRGSVSGTGAVPPEPMNTIQKLAKKFLEQNGKNTSRADSNYPDSRKDWFSNVIQDNQQWFSSAGMSFLSVLNNDKNKALLDQLVGSHEQKTLIQDAALMRNLPLCGQLASGIANHELSINSFVKKLQTRFPETTMTLHAIEDDSERIILTLKTTQISASLENFGFEKNQRDPSLYQLKILKKPQLSNDLLMICSV